MGKDAPGYTGGDDARAEEDRRKAAAQTEIANVEDIFSAFNPEYWAGQTADLESRYNPQVDTAFGEARGRLVANLASKGQSPQSSVYQQDVGRLEREGRTVREDLTSQIMEAIAGAEGNVLNRKQNLLSTISAASDPAGAGAGASALAQSLKTPVSTGFDVSGAFKDYRDMRSIADIINDVPRGRGGVQRFGQGGAPGRVYE